MDESVREEASGPVENPRRRFLRQLAAGAAATAATASPALAQTAAGAPAAPARTGPTLAETIADYALSLRYEDLPPEVVLAAKHTILDTFAAAIGAYRSEPPQIAIKLTAGVTATPGATVICSGARTSQDLATFANGVMIRYLDFNDAYSTPGGGGHPSDCLAALLSSAEVSGSSGRELIVATVAAYEVFCKIADVIDLKSVGIDQSTMLGLTSLIGAGRLMGLTRAQLINAIGITVGGNTSLNQGRVGDLSNWKDYATAESSRKAIFSARLAQAGMTGPAQIFEGPSGFYRVVTRKPFPQPKLGAPYGITRTVTKFFPVGQYAQSVVAAAVQMRSFFAKPEDIQEVNLHVSQGAIRVMAGSPDKWKPLSHETADHSMPYAAAVVLMYGTIDDNYYEPPYRTDPRLLDLVGKVKCIPSAEADQHEAEYNLCDFEIVLKSGARKTERVLYQRGHWKNPMTDAELDAKFRSLAGRSLAKPKVDALLRQLRALETMPKAGALLPMTKV